MQDAVRNVTIKPETTRRQDDVTGRLPRHTGYTSPRMTQSENAACSSHKNTSQKVRITNTKNTTVLQSRNKCNTQILSSFKWSLNKRFGASVNMECGTGDRRYKIRLSPFHTTNSFKFPVSPGTGNSYWLNNDATCQKNVITPHQKIFEAVSVA